MIMKGNQSHSGQGNKYVTSYNKWWCLNGSHVEARKNMWAIRMSWCYSLRVDWTWHGPGPPEEPGAWSPVGEEGMLGEGRRKHSQFTGPWKALEETFFLFLFNKSRKYSWKGWIKISIFFTSFLPSSGPPWDLLLFLPLSHPLSLPFLTWSHVAQAELKHAM